MITELEHPDPESDTTTWPAYVQIVLGTGVSVAVALGVPAGVPVQDGVVLGEVDSVALCDGVPVAAAVSVLV